MAVRVQVPPRVPWLLRNIVCSLSLCVAAQTNCTFVASIILKIFKLPLLAQFSFHPTVVRFVNGCMKSQDTSCTVRMIFSQKILSPHSQLNKCLNPQNVLPFFLSLPLPEKLRGGRPILCTCSQPEVYKLTSKLQSNFFIRHRTVKDYNFARIDHFTILSSPIKVLIDLLLELTIFKHNAKWYIHSIFKSIIKLSILCWQWIDLGHKYYLF